MQKLENAFQTHFRQGSASSTNSRTQADGSNSNSNANSRATTPPMQSLAKANMKIRMGKGEIEQKKGQQPQVVNFAGSD